MSFGFGVGDFVAILKLAHHVRKRIWEAPEDFKVLDTEVRNLSTTLQDVDVWLYTASLKQKESLLIVLEECDKLLHELQLLLEKSIDLQVPQRARDKEGLGHKLKKLRISVTWDSEAIKSFQLRIISSVTKLNSIGQKRLQEDVDGLVAHKDYQQHAGLVDWITLVDHATQQRDVLSKRVDQSASQWLLESEQFAVWLDGPGKTLFCPGIPGAGKTMTTAIVVDHLQSKQEPQSLTAFLYCSYRSQKEQSHDQLIASALRSLVQQLSRPPHMLQRLFDTQGRHGRPLTAQQTYSAVKHISDSVERVNVLVDALDELARETRDDIIATMLRLQQDADLSLFLTSRHNAGVEEKIHPNEALTIEIRAAPEDVQKYLRANLSRLPRCVSGKIEIQELIVQGIAEVVDGMFLLAELHLESLKNKTSAKEIRVALSKLSSGSDAITEAYNEAWHRINSQPEEHKNIAKQTIAILVTARRPLSAVELCHALSVDLEAEQVDDEEDVRDIEDILATCAGVVTVDQGSNTVRLVHMSTQDYFYRHRAEFFPVAEHILGNICAIYRRINSFNCGQFPSDDYAEEDPDWPEEDWRSHLRQFPFYDYAEENWWSHLKQATIDEELAIEDLVGEDPSTDRPIHSKLTTELSVQLGIEVFGSDPIIYTAALRACQTGNQSLLEGFLDIARFDLEKYANLVYVALVNRQQGIVKTLLSRGVPNSAFHIGPIIFDAIRLDVAEIVQIFLDFKADVESRDDHGHTPLLWAAAKGSLSCLKLLLKVANVAGIDSEGKGVLSVAIQNHQTEAAEMLLRCPEVNVIQCDKEARSPLGWAVLSAQHSVVTTLLEKSQVRDSIRNGVDVTILHRATKLANVAVVRALLGCDVVTRNCFRLIDGLSPLHCAAIRWKDLSGEFVAIGQRYMSDNARMPYRAIHKLLLDSGFCHVNAADNHGMTVLHHICTFATTHPSAKKSPPWYGAFRGHMLLDLCSVPGINLGAVDHKGETAMQKALKAGNIVHTKILVESGASICAEGAENLLCAEEGCSTGTQKLIDPKFR